MADVAEAATGGTAGANADCTPGRWLFTPACPVKGAVMSSAASAAVAIGLIVSMGGYAFDGGDAYR